MVLLQVLLILGVKFHHRGGIYIYVGGLITCGVAQRYHITFAKSGGHGTVDCRVLSYSQHLNA